MCVKKKKKKENSRTNQRRTEAGNKKREAAISWIVPEIHTHKKKKNRKTREG